MKHKINPPSLQTFLILSFFLVQHPSFIVSCETPSPIVISANQKDSRILPITSPQILPSSSLTVGLGALASLLASISAPAASIVLIAATGALAYTSITGRKVIPERLWRILGGQHCHVQWNLSDISPVILEEINKSQKPKEPSNKKLIYKPATYHKEVPLIFLTIYLSQNTSKIKSPCPPKAEGQMILDFLSFSIGPRHRMAYVGGFLIEFRLERDTPEFALFHGFYNTSSPATFQSQVQNTLRAQGIINGKGKLIR